MVNVSQFVQLKLSNGKGKTLKKLMKKLKDHHLKGCNQYNDYEHLYFNAEDMMNQVRFMRKNKYQEYKLMVN